jgi:SAM-dependent methyltransferase
MRISPRARRSTLVLARRIWHGATRLAAPRASGVMDGDASASAPPAGRSLRTRRRTAEAAADAVPATGAPQAARSIATPAGTAVARVHFRCNLCGARNDVPHAMLAREIASCPRCGSTVRFRAIARLVVREMLGIDAALPDLSRHRGIRGIGLSDDACYAHALGRAFDYTNTWYHAEPRLDITAVPPELRGRYDFVVASDVFEHVPPPVARAYARARALLRPGGALVLTVPFSLAPDTVEHFPELCDWRLEECHGAWRLHNVTADGRAQSFDGLVFHGGPGSTLEMRLFSRDALLAAFAAAGFAHVRIADEACERFGIEWREPWSVPMVAYAG